MRPSSRALQPFSPSSRASSTSCAARSRRSRASKGRSPGGWSRRCVPSRRTSSPRWRPSPAASPTSFSRRCSRRRCWRKRSSTTAATSPSTFRRVSVFPSASPGDFSGRAVPALNGAVMLRAEDGIGGIATSGFNGRSFTLGIADSVTVVAASAAAADAAATVVANAVDLDSPAIERRPASSARSGQRPRRPPRHERRRPPDRGRDPAGADERPVERRALDRARPHRRRRLDASGAKPRCGGAGARGAARDPGPGSLKSRLFRLLHTHIRARILTLPIVCVRMILC